MISAVALSPALDVTYVVTELHGIQRPLDVRRVGGGKALNAARAAARLGADVLALAVLGGGTGRVVREAAEADGVRVEAFDGGTLTRTCTSISSAATGELTEIYETAVPVPAGTFDALLTRLADVAGQLRKRPIRDEARGVTPARPAWPVAADHLQAATEHRGQRLGPWAHHDVPDAGPAVDRDLDGGAQADLVLHDAPVRTGEAQHRGRGIGVGGHLDELADDRAVDEPAGVVDEEEAPVLDDADLGQVDLGRVLQGQAAHGRDREAGDLRHGRMLTDDRVPQAEAGHGPGGPTSGRRRTSCRGWARGEPRPGPGPAPAAYPGDR